MRISGFKVSLVVATIGMSPFVRAINIRDGGRDIDFQNLANEAQFSAVGICDAGLVGTGTFIGFGNDKAWVLTSEHVMSGFNNASRFKLNGKSYEFGDTFYRLSDMAVVPILGVREGDITPAKFLGAALNIPAELGQRTLGTFVGYGKSGTGSNPESVDDGKKRAAQQRIDGYKVQTLKDDGSLLQQYDGYMGDFDNGTARRNTLDVTDNTNDKLKADQKSSRTEESMEGSLGRGDSGGPLFVHQSDQWLIAGVAWQSFDGSGYGGWSNWLAMDAEYSAFVTRRTGINSVPEPATALGFLVFLLPIFSSRLKRPG